MHKYVTGYWAASSYSITAIRTDHVLFLSPDGAFQWVREADGRRSLRLGTWLHDTEQDVLTLTSTDGTVQPTMESWSIHYVSGSEASNMILVLRWVALASPNLPILFQRIHPAADPVWGSGPKEGG